MKIFKLAIASLLFTFYSCSNNKETLIEDSNERLAIQEYDQIIPNDTITIESWLGTSSNNDSNWFVLTEFNEKLEESKFIWHRLSRNVINQSKKDYKTAKIAAINARKQISADTSNYHEIWGEGYLEMLWIEQPLDSIRLIESIEWTKLESIEQYRSLNWTGWHSAGEFGLEFSIKSISLKDCLTVVLAPFAVDDYGDFEGDYKGRYLPHLKEGALTKRDTLWAFDHYSNQSFMLYIPEVTGYDSYPIVDFMRFNTEKFPDWIMNPDYVEANKSIIERKYIDLTNNGVDEEILLELNQLHNLELNLQPIRKEIVTLQGLIENSKTETQEERLAQDKLEIKKLLLEIKIKKEDGNPYTDPEQDIDRVEAMKRLANRLENRIIEERIKEERNKPCEGYKNCSFEVRQQLEGAGWQLVGDVQYQGKGVHYAVGAKPMETGVKEIYYTMDCDCQPLDVRFR